MSGLTQEKKNSTNNIYLSVMNGFLVQKVSSDTPNAVMRLNKNNEEVFELKYTGLTAKIKNIAIVDGKFGKELEIKMFTEGQNFVIQTPANGGYAFGFLARMVNLDFSKETELRPFAIYNKEKDKTNHVIVLYQDGIKIEGAFTKENPNGLPDLVKLKDASGKEILKGGKPVWDDSARLDFFETVIYGEGGINEKLISLYGNASQVAANEDKTDFLEDTEAPIIENDGTPNPLDETANIDADAEAQKAEIEAQKKAETKKAAAKKVTKK